MRRDFFRIFFVLAQMALMGCASASSVSSGASSAPCSTSRATHVDIAVLVAEVMATETAFAKTMADRDAARFATYLATDTIFFNGESATRGQSAVAESWSKWFRTKEAPFSWKPEQVQVLDSGDLALSTGPVFNAKGQKIATFNSIWRRESPGIWRVVFDRGCDVCAEKTP